LIVMTSDSPAVGAVVESMESGLAAADRFLAAGDPAAAMGAASAAAGDGDGEIQWSSRGHDAADDGAGFVGTAPADLIFRDGFESEDLTAWTQAQP
jgi:hypothetical protein